MRGRVDCAVHGTSYPAHLCAECESDDVDERAAAARGAVELQKHRAETAEARVVALEREALASAKTRAEERETAWRWVAFGVKQYQELMRELIPLRLRDRMRGRTIFELQQQIHERYASDGLHGWCKALEKRISDTRDLYYASIVRADKAEAECRRLAVERDALRELVDAAIQFCFDDYIAGQSVDRSKWQVYAYFQNWVIEAANRDEAITIARDLAAKGKGET